MAETARKAWIAAAALLVVVVVAAAGFYVSSQRAERDLAPSAATAPDGVVAAVPVEATSPPAAPVQASASAGSCPAEPLLPLGAAGDGQFALQAALATSLGSEAGVYLKVADEVASQGRPRDAEVAWIVACRIAEQAGGFSSAPLADVKSRLAQHYAAVAATPGAQPIRLELLARAETLLGDSVKAYTASLGGQSSRTRQASQRLAALGQATAQPQAAAGPVDAGAMGAAPLSLQQRPPRMDEDVAELDQDMQRLYAQASAVARDPAGMQRRHQQALAARTACRDDACLRHWYAQRKKQLFAEF